MEVYHFTQLYGLNSSNEYGWFFYTLREDFLSKLDDLVREIENIETIEDLKEFFISNENLFGKINYVVWSDVYICPTCATEIVYWDSAYDKEKGKVYDVIECKKCGSKYKKNQLERAWDTFYDEAIDKVVKQIKQVPVKISYSIGNKRYDKVPDKLDLVLISKINKLEIPYWFPTNEIPNGDKTGEPIRLGITHIHHFYTKRNLFILSYLWKELPYNMKWILTSFVSRNATKTNRFVINKYNPKGRINGPLTGTFYIPNLIVEQSVLQLFKDKIFNG